jgi:hypothetical protein
MIETSISSRDSLPACLIQENPYRPVSLRSLLVKYAHFFFINGDMLRAAIDSLASIADRLEAGERSPDLLEYLQSRLRHAAGAVRCVGTLCDDLPLPVSKKAMERARVNIERFTQAESMVIGSLAHELDGLAKTIADELDSIEFMAIRPDRRKYFYADVNLFGEAVAEKFPSSTTDIVEAGRCFALWRNTACVFHCMRVLEVGLQCLGAAIGMTDPRPNWEPVIARLDKLLRMTRDHLNRNPSEAVPEVHQNTDYYAGVSSYFNAVKIAWRNRVMHVGLEYTDEHTFLILNATEGFMKHLAGRLCEAQSVAQ